MGRLLPDLWKVTVPFLFDLRPHPYRMRPQIKGLSHGLKTCHRHVFAPVHTLVPPFRVHPSGVPKRRGVSLWRMFFMSLWEKSSCTDTFWYSGRRWKGLGAVVFPFRKYHVRSCRRPAGGKRMSTGHLHLIVRIPSGINKNRKHRMVFPVFGTAKLTKSEPNPASARAVSMSSNVMVSAPSLWLQ